jgi:peptidoglycan hydrolase-like protein with peptidoglycan-binding domain
VRPDKPTKYLDFKLPVLKRGMRGGAVFALQALLIGYGYDLGKKGLDGSFGKATEAALKKYQHEHDLEVDGSCGRATWTSLLGLEDG